MNEIQFTKYKTRSSDYHYKQINKFNLRKLNAFVLARYLKQIQLIEEYISKLGFSSETSLNILDVGCGDGVLLYLLKKQIKNINFNMFGIDLSEEAIKTAKHKIPEAQFSVSEVYHINFQENTFDLIISSDVIEHVQYPEKMTAEIKRISKKDALIIIGTPVRISEKPFDTMHVKEFFQHEFIELFSTYFRFIELRESHKMFSYLKYKKQIKYPAVNLNRYLFNVLTILNLNPFMKFVSSKDLPVYMFAVGQA